MCGCLLHDPYWGTWPATQACALTGNRTSDPLLHSPAFNPLSHTSQEKECVFKKASEDWESKKGALRYHRGNNCRKWRPASELDEQREEVWVLRSYEHGEGISTVGTWISKVMIPGCYQYLRIWEETPCRVETQNSDGKVLPGWCWYLLGSRRGWFSKCLLLPAWRTISGAMLTGRASKGRRNSLLSCCLVSF